MGPTWPQNDCGWRSGPLILSCCSRRPFPSETCQSRRIGPISSGLNPQNSFCKDCNSFSEDCNSFCELLESKSGNNRCQIKRLWHHEVHDYGDVVDQVLLPDVHRQGLVLVGCLPDVNLQNYVYLLVHYPHMGTAHNGQMGWRATDPHPQRPGNGLIQERLH